MTYTINDSNYISDIDIHCQAMPEIIQVISKYHLSIGQTQALFSHIMDELVYEPLAIHDYLLQPKNSDIK